jgi:hypothetical protein
MENKSCLHLYFRFYTSFSSLDFKSFYLNYEDYYIKGFNPHHTNNFWLKVDGRKCRLLNLKVEIGKEFETSERIQDRFNENYFAKKKEEVVSSIFKLEYF